MVKGLSKRVIVVKSPDPQLFEEAIFIIRDDAFKEYEKNPERILNEARRAACDYLKSIKSKRKGMTKTAAAKEAWRRG